MTIRYYVVCLDTYQSRRFLPTPIDTCHACADARDSMSIPLYTFFESRQQLHIYTHLISRVIVVICTMRFHSILHGRSLYVYP